MTKQSAIGLAAFVASAFAIGMALHAMALATQAIARANARATHTIIAVAPLPSIARSHGETIPCAIIEGDCMVAHGEVAR